MGWRTVIISNTAKLDYKMGYLCIRSNEDVKRIFIDEISVLIIENTNVSLTTYLLVELANKSVDIIFVIVSVARMGCIVLCMVRMMLAGLYVRKLHGLKNPRC